MNPMGSRLSRERPLNVEAICRLIADTQKQGGEIPWFEAGKTDPWDHVEAAIGLTIGGHKAAARRAFRWMKRMQRPDGSWFAAFHDGQPLDRTLDANFSAYIAVGVFHHLLATGNMEFVRELWPTVEAAVEFALHLQAPGGEIQWAVSPEGFIDPMALLTGSSSIYMSLKCALALAKTLDLKRPAWQWGLQRLEWAIRHKPHLFNVAKSRFSMDWFYPVLSGAVTGAAAKKRIQRHWKKFVVNGQGVKCVSDEPWVTLAETAELVLALSAMGNRRLAHAVFGWTQDKRYPDDTYWCGFTYPDMTIWPEEKVTWTNAVVLMAADALYRLTPAWKIFSHAFWAENTVHHQIAN